VYNASRRAVETNVQRMIDFYNQQVDQYAKRCTREGSLALPQSAESVFIDRDTTKISKTERTRAILAGIRYSYRRSALTTSSYGPFTKAADLLRPTAQRDDGVPTRRISRPRRIGRRLLRECAPRADYPSLAGLDSMPCLDLVGKQKKK
jgi:hypothetical protein